jgi:hypothetical protein
MITTDNRLPNMGDIAPNTECSVSARMGAGCRTLTVTIITAESFYPSLSASE